MALTKKGIAFLKTRINSFLNREILLGAVKNASKDNELRLRGYPFSVSINASDKDEENLQILRKC